MRIAAVAALLLLAPDKTVELRYRFEKGMVYEDVQKRHMEMESYGEGGKVAAWKLAFEIDLKRTVLEADGTHHPTSERVEVRKFRREVIEAADEKPGSRPFACEGKTFAWRRLKERWGLFLGEAEVTAEHKTLVNHLKSWRDARLPKTAVAPGDSWEVTAADFLRTAGLEVPKGVKGAALFTLEKLDGDVATIPFHIRFSYKSPGHAQEMEESGRWLFDVKRGRDLAFEMEGKLAVDGGKGGKGTLRMTRRVTHSR